jgi:prephenate dehydrogenase
MAYQQFKKIVIFGVGLIGGSFALALKKAGSAGVVVGFGRSHETLQQAQQLAIIDRIGVDEATEVRDADIVLIATPVAQMADIFRRIAPHLGSHTLVTDGGSTKGDVVAAAYANLGGKIAQFVPAHPIAGAEKSGPEAALADLYVGKRVVLTPLTENSGEAVARIKQAWELCGANVSVLTAEQHDRVFAAVSHLPHLLSFALVHDIAQRENKDQLLSFAASGFRDFTRIAASSPEMWRDICLANRDTLMHELLQYTNELHGLYQALEQRDADKLEQTFRTAREVRSAWAEK